MSRNVDLATGEVRLSFPNLVTPRERNGRLKYGVTALVPKSDEATVAAIRKACADVYEDACGKDGVFAGRRPQVSSDALLHDGDGLKRNGTEYGPECKGHWVVYLSAPAQTADGRPVPRPGIVTQDNPTHPLTDDEAGFIPAGAGGRVARVIYACSANGSDGITASLLYTMWTRAGEPLGGVRPPVDIAALFGTAPMETAVFQPASAGPKPPAEAPAPKVVGTPPAPAPAEATPELTPEAIAALKKLGLA